MSETALFNKKCNSSTQHNIGNTLQEKKPTPPPPPPPPSKKKPTKKKKKKKNNKTTTKKKKKKKTPPKKTSKQKTKTNKQQQNPKTNKNKTKQKYKRHNPPNIKKKKKKKRRSLLDHKQVPGEIFSLYFFFPLRLATLVLVHVVISAAVVAGTFHGRGLKKLKCSNTIVYTYVVQNGKKLTKC